MLNLAVLVLLASISIVTLVTVLLTFVKCRIQRSAYVKRPLPYFFTLILAFNCCLIVVCSGADDIRLLPILSNFDLRVIFAPAIVSKDGSASRLVCGHSVELNATSDLDFFLSVAQLHMLCSILTSNVSCLVSATHPEKAFSRGPPVSVDTNATLDSGLGSEASVAVRHTVTSMREPCKSRNSSGWDWISLATFDILLTAGRISLMLYDHTPSAVPADGGSVPADCSELLSARVEPLLHVSFSQPHSFIICETSNQKIELSCYDMSVRGPQPGGHSASSLEEPNLLPDTNDFVVHWIETKPGKVDAKTGIPACLYTLRIINYLSFSGLFFACIVAVAYT